MAETVIDLSSELIKIPSLTPYGEEIDEKYLVKFLAFSFSTRHHKKNLSR